MTDRKKYKLSDDNYKRPNVTATDLLSTSDIKSRLKNFEKIKKNEIKNIKPYTRIQYFEVFADNKYRYKPGGSLLINKAPDYLVLTNGRKNWSVQLDSHIIFAEIDIDLIKKEYEDIIAQKNRDIEHLKELIREQKNKLNKN